MSSRYGAIENILKGRGVNHLKYLIREWGIKIKIYPPKASINSRVYGIEAGEEVEEEAFDIIGLVTSDDFFPTSQTASGSFEEGWLYVENVANVKVGSKISLISEDNRTRNYKVSSKESLGLTTNIFDRFKILALTK